MSKILDDQILENVVGGVIVSIDAVGAIKAHDPNATNWGLGSVSPSENAPVLVWIIRG